MEVVYRRRLFECVEENQGAHLRDLARRTMIPLGTTLYHLDRLESCGLVVARRDGRYRRFFAGHSLGIAEKEILGVLRRAVPRRIAVALLEVGASTELGLCARIGVSRSTMSFHVQKLVARRFLRREGARPESRYLLEDVGLTARLVEKYGPGLGDVGPLRVAGPIEAPGPLATSVAPTPAASAGGA